MVKRISSFLLLVALFATSCEDFECGYRFPRVNPERSIPFVQSAIAEFGPPTLRGSVQRVPKPAGYGTGTDAELDKVIASLERQSAEAIYWERKCLGRTWERMWIFVNPENDAILEVRVELVP